MYHEVYSRWERAGVSSNHWQTDGVATTRDLHIKYLSLKSAHDARDSTYDSRRCISCGGVSKPTIGRVFNYCYRHNTKRPLNVHEMYTTSMICLLSLPIAMTLSIHKTNNILQSSYSKHSQLLKSFISRISYVETSKPNIILFTNCSNASSPSQNVLMVASYQYRGQRDRYHC